MAVTDLSAVKFTNEQARVLAEVARSFKVKVVNVNVNVTVS